MTAPSMIEWDSVSVTYPDAPSPALDRVNLRIHEGELALVIGPTGSGKSTLLRSVNGLVPHFTGGVLSGRVTVAGRDTATHPPRELADVVGYVAQDPRSTFVTDSVEEELAYTMESLGIAPQTMRRRVEETLDLLGLADIRTRPLGSLSGGQRQRVAIGSVLTASPRILVLDEPTSALDPGAAEEVLAAIQRLVHDLGITVLLAEHRLERVLEYADRVIVVPAAGQSIYEGSPAEVMRSAPLAPAVVRLGRLAQWDPLPLSVRDARRLAPQFRERLLTTRTLDCEPSLEGDSPTEPAIIGRLDDVSVRHGQTVALRCATMDILTGDVIAVMGRNGAGKSTLIGALAGMHATSGGSVRIDNRDPRTLRGSDLLHHIGVVPSDFGDLLTRSSVAAECTDSDHDAGAPPGTTRSLLDELAPQIDADTHPRDLSEGQRLALALAVILAGSPPLICLDEPTRGLDYESKERLVDIISRLRHSGHAVVMATHDVELASDVATRVVILADGEIVANGPTAEVVVGSPLFAPQVAKVLTTAEQPSRWLTPRDVVASLDEVMP